MEVDIEKIHVILIEADLPSSINDLKNPTEDFVINLMNAFLKKFHIDVSVIDKPTIEQRDIMPYSEDFDIVGLINLHVAMIQICERIFCEGPCITDITSPGSKKVRKQAKFLANFILYANNKVSDIKDKIDEIQNRANLLHNLLEQKNEVMEAIKDKVLYTGTQLSRKEKLIVEIEKLQSKLEKNNRMDIELNGRLRTAEEKKQQAIHRCGTYKSQALKLSKTIGELQSEIVESPEDYQMRLNELEQQQSAMVKEREILQETFQDKKHSIEQQKNILTFVQKQKDQFSAVKDAYSRLKKAGEQEESIQKQIDLLKADITEFERKLENQKDQCKDTEIDGIHAQYEKRLSPLRSLSTQLLSNKKVLKAKLEEVQLQQNEDCLKLKKMQGQIKKGEEETATLLRNYQDLYNSEIQAEKTLWKTWTIG